MRDAGAFFSELGEGLVHAFAAEVVDRQVADQLIVAGLGHHRHAVDHAFGNAVAAIGGHAHGHPFAVAAQQPVVDVVDGGVGGGGRGGQAARFADGGAALADGDRKSVGEGKSVSVRVDLGGRRIIKKKK